MKILSIVRIATCSRIILYNAFLFKYISFQNSSEKSKISFNSTAVLVDIDAETVLRYAEINDFDKHPSTIIHLKSYQTHEAP